MEIKGGEVVEIDREGKVGFVVREIRFMCFLGGIRFFDGELADWWFYGLGFWRNLLLLE